MRFAAVVLIALSVILLDTPDLGAQPRWALDKGSVAIGGHASFGIAGGMVQGFNDKTTVDLSPFAYYLTSSNIGIGGLVYVNSSSREDGESSTTMGVGPSLLLAFADSSYSWYPFLQLSALWASASEKSPYVETGQVKTGSGFALEFAGGGTYMLGRHVGINVQGYYQIQWITVDAETNTGKQYGLRVGFTGFIF
jgi:hypothetical protein